MSSSRTWWGAGSPPAGPGPRRGDPRRGGSVAECAVLVVSPTPHSRGTLDAEVCAARGDVDGIVDPRHPCCQDPKTRGLSGRCQVRVGASHLSKTDPQAVRLPLFRWVRRCRRTRRATTSDRVQTPWECRRALAPWRCWRQSSHLGRRPAARRLRRPAPPQRARRERRPSRATPLRIAYRPRW